MKPARFALALAAFIQVAEGQARAQDTPGVVLKDGTVLTGDLLEYMTGDHITLKLSGGDERVVRWSELAHPEHPLWASLPRSSWTLLPPSGGGALRSQSSVTWSLTVPTAAPPTPPAPDRDDDSILTSAIANAAKVSDAKLDSWPEPDRSPPPIPEARLSVGGQIGLNSPLGSIGLIADYFPVSWFGIEGAFAFATGGEPVTTGEKLLFEWWYGGGFAEGLGVGLAQSQVSSVVPGGRSGVVSYLDLDCSHLTVFFIPSLAMRASAGFSVPIVGGDYCTAHPEVCPPISNVPVYGNLALLWNFDLTHGQQ